MYINNIEVLFKAYKEKWIIYVPMYNLYAYISNYNKELIVNGNLDIRDVLKNNGANIFDNKNKEILPWLSLNISDNCQLRCQYCYLSAEDGYDMMSAEKGKNIFCAFIEYLKKNFQIEIIKKHKIWISFYGGAEPTYNFAVLEDMVSYIRKYERKNELSIGLRITTNGYYSKDRAEYIAENFDSILLSLDGPNFVHNIHRRTVADEDSFDLVYQSARVFFEKAKKVEYRITVSEITERYLDDIFSFYASNFPGAKIIVGFVSEIGRAQLKEIHTPKEKSDIWLACMKKYEDELCFRMNDRRLGMKRNLYCGAVKGSNFIISNDNSIRSCAHYDEEQEFIIGKYIENEIFIDQEKIRILRRKYNIDNYSECVECICKYDCCGGCPSNRLCGIKNNCDFRVNQYVEKIVAHLDKC